MKEKEKKEKKTTGKVAVNTGKAVRAYAILTSQKTEQREGFKLTADLDTQDIFKVLRATNALKPVATAFTDFQKDAQERLKPEGWDDETMPKIQKFKELSDEEKIAVNKTIGDYNGKVAECVSTEADKDKETDAYEHLSEEAFATLVKGNQHLLDLNDIMLLQEMIG